MNRGFFSFAVTFYIVALLLWPKVRCHAQIGIYDTLTDRTRLAPAAALESFRGLLNYSRRIDSPDGAFVALIGMSIKYWEAQEFVEMRKSCEAALPWARRSPQKDAVAWAYNNIGLSYYLEGDYFRASQYLYTALKELTAACGNEPNHTRANIYNGLGRINMRLNQREKALEYFAMAEDVCLRGKQYFQLGENYTERGIYYNSIHKPDSAVKYFTEVMNIGKRIKKIDLQAIANCNLGKTAIETGDYEQAIEYLQRSIVLAQGIYNYIVIDAMYAMGDVLCRQGKYKQAEEILVAALKETREHNFRDRYTDVYTKLAAVYRATGRYKAALDCMDSILAIKDTLTSIGKATAYNQLEMKYNTTEKDKQIAENKLLIAQQQSNITRKNIWIGVVAGSIFLLVVVVGAVYRNTRQKERLQVEHIKSLQQQHKIGTLKAIVQGEENERGRIARDLHDGIGGMLAAAMMRFMTMRHDNEGINQNAAYREAMAMLDQVGDEIRKTAHNLMPEVLKKQDLAEAVRAFCSYMQEKDMLKIEFQSYGSFDSIPGDAKLHIYRMLQELLKNIKQHAQASTALVQLMMNEHTLAITVEDNGIGFDTSKVKTGIGLHNVETRVSSMGGTYTIESEAGKGTMIYIELDMQQIPTS